MSDTKTVISIQKPTPMWATWVFRAVFLLTGVATGIIMTDPAIPAEVANRWAIYLKGLDTLVWGLTRIIGVEIPKEQ